MTEGRYYTNDLLNDMELPTLYANNATIKVNRYSNGVVTVNCARIIRPNQPATNGILHVIEKVPRVTHFPHAHTRTHARTRVLGQHRNLIRGELLTTLLITGNKTTQAIND